MAIENQNGILAQLASKNKGGTTTSGRAAAKGDLPQAQVWLNFGYTVTNSEGVDKFINLPLGLPLDTMEGVRVPRNADEYAQIQAARNQLLAELQAAGDSLAPGEFKTVHLEVQIRRVNDEVEVDPATNIFSLGNAGFKIA